VYFGFDLGDRVEQIGSREVNATGDTVFKVKQTID
jgi:hypothetical protein